METDTRCREQAQTGCVPEFPCKVLLGKAVWLEGEVSGCLYIELYIKLIYLSLFKHIRIPFLHAQGYTCTHTHTHTQSTQHLLL